MPNITVTFTPELDQSEPVDWTGFVSKLTACVVSLAGARPEAVRTVISPPEETGWFLGGEAMEDGKRAVHVEIALKAGRGDDTRERLSRAALELVREHLPASRDYDVHISVEVREIDPVGYSSHVEPRQG